MAEKEFRHIVRVANTDLDGNKPVYHALTKIKGVGPMFSNMACALARVNKKAKTGELSDEDVGKLNDVLINPLKHKAPLWMFNRRKDFETGEDRHTLTSDLDWAKETDIKLMKKMKCYKGVRHSNRLPVRGQRTRSNFRKNKGKVQGVQRKAQQQSKKPADKDKK